MKKINWAIAAIIISNLIWGATPAVMKLALQNVPVFFLALTRFLLAALILYPFAHSKASYSDLKNKYLWIYALCGVTANIALFFLALNFTSSINASLIGCTGPVFIFIFSAMFLHEKVSRREILGMAIAFFGVLTIVLEPILHFGLNGHVLGNVLMIVATLAAVAATIAGRKFLTPKNLLPSTFWIFTIGAISFMPFALWEFIQNPYTLAALDGRGVTGIIFGAVFASTIAYYSHNFALSRLPAHKVSIFTYMDPVVAVLVAIPLLGESLTVPFIMGSLLVFTGIFIAEKRIHYHPLHKLLEK